MLMAFRVTLPTNSMPRSAMMVRGAPPNTPVSDTVRASVTSRADFPSMGTASAYREKASMTVRRYFLRDLTETGPTTST